MPGVGSATLSRCCAPRSEMVGDAGEGNALPHLHSRGRARVRVKPWHCPCPCEPGVPPWLSLALSLHLSSLDLLPHSCSPLGSSSSIRPQSLLLLPEQLTQHCIKWSVCLMDITMHLLQPDLEVFLIILLPQPSLATVSDF